MTEAAELDLRSARVNLLVEEHDDIRFYMDFTVDGEPAEGTESWTIRGGIAAEPGGEVAAEFDVTVDDDLEHRWWFELDGDTNTDLDYPYYYEVEIDNGRRRTTIKGFLLSEPGMEYPGS